MVYIAPPRGEKRPARGGPGQNANKGGRGQRRGRNDDVLASKAEMLAQLTRQAEENTRILQREREALGIQGPSIFSEPEQQPHRHGGGGRGDGRGGRGAGGAANAQRNNANNRRNHIFTDQGNKKVFDPRNIPGLGGAADNDFGGGGGGNDLTLGGEGGMLNQTFPDSPNFYPGFVFAIPATLPPPQQQQQQAPSQAEASLTVISAVPGQQGPGLQHPPNQNQQYLPQSQQPGPPQHQQYNQQGGLGTMLGSPGGGGGHGMGPGGPGAGGLKGGILGMSLAMNGTVIGGQQRFGGGRGQQQQQQQPQQQQQQQPGPFGNGQGGSGGAGTPNGGSYGTPGGGGGGGIAALAGGGGGGPVSSDPRVQARMEAEAKKEAYRRELEEQIRARQAAKDAEARRRREEEEQWEARARQAPPPWDPAARAQRRGGGGEPLRDDFGRPVADLRARPGRGSPGGGMAPSPGGFPPPPGPPQQRLTVEVPGGGAGAYPPGMGPMHAGMMGVGMGMGGLAPDGASPHGGTLMPMGGGPGGGPGGHMMMMGGPGGPGGGAPVLGGNLPLDGPPVAPGAVLSPNAIPPVSPGNRRFMAAMNDLIAGPSDEQRRNAEEARQRLQSDLEAQIREKKERQARERAERERERLKEEADLKAYYDNMNQQRGQPRGPPGGGPPQQPPMQMGGGMGGMGGGMGMGDMPPPGPGPRRRGKGVIVDASWLDAPKPPPGPLPPLAQPPQPGPPLGPGPLPAQFGRRGAMAGPDDLPDAGPGMMIPRSPSPGPGPGGLLPRERGISYAGGGGLMAEPSGGGMGGSPGAPLGPGGGGGGGGGNTVTGLLHQLQEEQSRMREDFARQAAAMEKLASDASRALADRDEAWRELQRVKALLAGGAPAAAAGGLGGPAAGPMPGAGGLGFGPLGMLGLGGGAGVPGAGDSMEQYAATTVVINTHLVPKSLNAIPDALPKPLASEVLRRGHTDPGPHGSGIRAVGGGGGGGGGAGGAAGGGEGRFSSDGGAGGGAGGYDGGFGYEELERFQAQLRVGGGGSRAGRSGIPLPPGMGGPRSGGGGGGMVPYGRLESLNGPGMGMNRAPGIQSVYGLGFESPSAAGGGGGPKGQQPRYNGFFSGGPDPHEGHGSPVGGGGGGGMGRGHPPHLAPLKPPPSPGILRGDHLPSPSQKTRPGADKAGAGPGGGGGGGAGGSSRVRSGRNAGGGPPERQPRSAHPPQAPSAGAAAAAAGLAARAARNPALEHGDGAHPTGLPPPAPRSAARRSTEGMQKLLRRGREGEKLLRTNQLAQHDAGGNTGDDSHLPDYSMDELPSMADAEMGEEGEEAVADEAAARRRAMRQRERSMPGHSEHVPTESGASMLGGGGPHQHPHLPDITAHRASHSGASHSGASPPPTAGARAGSAPSAAAADVGAVAAAAAGAAAAAAHHDDEDGYSDDFHHDHDDDHHNHGDHDHRQQQQQQHDPQQQEEQQHQHDVAHQDQQPHGGGGGSRAGRLSDGGFGGVVPKLQHTESVATHNSFKSQPSLGARVPSPASATAAPLEAVGDDAAGDGGAGRALVHNASGSRASRVSEGGSATVVGGGAAGVRALMHGGGGSRGSGAASAPGRGSAMDAVLAAAAAGGGGGSFGKPGSAGSASAAAAAAEAAGVPVRRPVRPIKRTSQPNGSQSGVPQDDASPGFGNEDEAGAERAASDEE